ncbi:MAG: hypothetical protein ACK561_16435 [Pseudomonadaceae bacterium]
MQVTGGGEVLEYGPEQEGPQKPGNDPFWQDSVVLVWWDLENQVGGMHRIGHEVNVAGGPQVALWNYLFSPHHIFKREDRLPLRANDRDGRTFNSGDDTCVFEYTDHPVWRINDRDVSAELHVTDHHAPVDIYPKKGAMADDVAPNHMEVAGRVSGELTLMGKHYTINGLAFRDHGWGNRKWDVFVGHRWMAGVLKDGTMLFAQTFHSSDDQLVRFGCVIKDNTLTYAKHVDILMYLEPDGVTHRGGRVEMTLSTGEVIQLECTPLQKGIVSWLHGIACVDTLCRIEHDGVEGICDFETTNNALRGSQRPGLAVNGVLDNGMTQLG